jgi:hypothetical protein
VNDLFAPVSSSLRMSYAQARLARENEVYRPPVNVVEAAVCFCGLTE